MITICMRHQKKVNLLRFKLNSIVHFKHAKNCRSSRKQNLNEMKMKKNDERKLSERHVIRLEGMSETGRRKRPTTSDDPQAMRFSPLSSATSWL